MLKVTTRYLASNFIPPFIIGFIFFVAFLITFYMFRVISLIVNKGVDVATVLGMISNLSVSFFPMAAPLAIFFATIYTLGKLSEDSEIIAMRSFGLTKFKIYLPFFVVSFLIGVVINSLSSVYIPIANANFKNTIVKLTSRGMLTSIKAGQFFTDIPGATLFAESVNEEGDNFEDVFLHVKNKNADGQQIIFAKKGSLVKLYADNWHAPSLRLHLSDGNIIKLDQKGAEIEKVLFQEYDFPIFNADFTMTSLNKDSMKTNAELVVAIKERKAEYLSNTTRDEAAKKEAAKAITKGEIEYSSRLMPLPQIVLFVFLGFTLGIKKGRGKGTNNTVRAIGSILGFYALYFFLISLSLRGTIPSVLVVLVPLLFLFSIATYYYRKLDWIG